MNVLTLFRSRVPVEEWSHTAGIRSKLSRLWPLGDEMVWVSPISPASLPVTLAYLRHHRCAFTAEDGHRVARTCVGCRLDWRRLLLVVKAQSVGSVPEMPRYAQVEGLGIQARTAHLS